MTQSRKGSIQPAKSTADAGSDPAKSDAEGQFHRGRTGAGNDGLASAEPRVFGGRERQAAAWNDDANPQPHKPRTGGA